MTQPPIHLVAVGALHVAVSVVALLAVVGGAALMAWAVSRCQREPEPGPALSLGEMLDNLDAREAELAHRSLANPYTGRHRHPQGTRARRAQRWARRRGATTGPGARALVVQPLIVQPPLPSNVRTARTARPGTGCAGVLRRLP